MIHVGGYKMCSDYTVHVFSLGSSPAFVPDRLVPAAVHPAGSMEWYEEGWAVGENSRERFCKWGGAKPMYRFHDYDEAVTYIYHLRQKRKRPNEVYTLVYFTKGLRDIERHRNVSLLDDIIAFEVEISAEIEQHNKNVALSQQNLGEIYPEMDRLIETCGLSKAYRLSSLLKVIRQDGEKIAMQSIPKSSFYRDVRELRKFGLLD